MVYTAKEFGMTPSEFFKLSSEDKAIMMAYIGITSKMEQANADKANKRWQKK